MKHALIFLVLVGSTTQAVAEMTKDPVVTVMKVTLRRQSANIVKSAEQMPREKYDYRPTARENTFAQLVINVIELNDQVCAVAGAATHQNVQAPQQSDGKDRLLTALKLSFEGCEAVFAKLNDSKLGDTVTFTREMEVPRVSALFALVEGWASTHSILSEYLRLNGLESYP